MEHQIKVTKAPQEMWLGQQERKCCTHVSGTLPPHDPLGQPGQSCCQFTSDVLGKVLDPGSKRHHHKAMFRCVIDPGLKLLWE